jgi:hypothetical protein
MPVELLRRSKSTFRVILANSAAQQNPSVKVPRQPDKSNTGTNPESGAERLNKAIAAGN